MPSLPYLLRLISRVIKYIASKNMTRYKYFTIYQRIFKEIFIKTYFVPTITYEWIQPIFDITLQLPRSHGLPCGDHKWKILIKSTCLAKVQYEFSSHFNQKPTNKSSHSTIERHVWTLSFSKVRVVLTKYLHMNSSFYTNLISLQIKLLIESYNKFMYLKQSGKSIIFYQTPPQTPHPNSLFPEKDLSLIFWEIGPQVGETNFTHGSNPKKNVVRSLIDKHILLLGKYTMINCWQYRLCKGCLSWLPSGSNPCGHKSTYPSSIRWLCSK